MTSIRLLPIVVMAASALLVLKSVGLVTGQGYSLSGMSLAMAQDAPAVEEPVAVDEEGYTEDQLAAAEAAAQALFGSTTRPGAADGETVLRELTGGGIDVPMIERMGETERVLLERLVERRAELDAIESAVNARLAVVEAAEVRIEERMAELSAVEARINALVDARNAEEAEQFAGLVAMYEGMRPTDAATIFDRLNIDVLTRVGRAMNPRRLGPIMAKMTPQRAEELTMALARVEGEIDPSGSVAQGAELPQIVGQ
jgi:flagellar motility protein MotE (MotC chaperone)